MKAGDREEWTRVEYSVKASIDHDEEVAVAKAQVEGLINGWLTGVAKPAPTTAPSNIFPKELADLLLFEEAGERIIIRPRQFLGSENFAKIAAIVREAGGEYISAGKNSHFKLPRKKLK